MELSPDGIDVGKRQFSRVSAIREQDEHSLVFGVNPTTGSGESRVAKRIERQAGTGRRVFGRRELPGK